MGLSITLRTTKDTSHFRRNLLNLIRTPGTEKLLLCSGYVSEGSSYSVLNDELLHAIQSHCSKVITVAGMFGFFNWKPRYLDFVRKLKTSGINVDSYSIKRGNWHAKVAMKLNHERPIACIVGSSNLTSSAYREKKGRFNHEADVLMWEDSALLDRHFRPTNERQEDLIDPIYAVLNDRIPQSNETDRMRKLYQLIMSQLDPENI